MKRLHRADPFIMVGIVVVLLLLSMFAIRVAAQNTRPTLVESPPGLFTATFDQGAYAIQFYFHMLDPHPDFPAPKFYRPVKEWAEIYEHVTFGTGWDMIKPTDSEWDIYVRVYYIDDQGPSFVESNHVRTHR